MDLGRLTEGGPMLARSWITDHHSSTARAFCLVEILAVILVLPLVMVAITAMFRTFIRDVPQMTRLVQQNTTVLNLLDQMRRDVGSAVTLPAQCEDTRASENVLLIEKPDAVVCYRLDAGRVVRTILDGPGGDERVWSARDAVMEWRPWTQGGATCAVEIHSYVKQRAHGHLMRKFAASHVFFAHSLSEGVEIP